MKNLIYLFFIFLFLSCSGRPDNVLSEDDMIDLLVDLHKGEAYVEINKNKYYNDSLKKTVRQSVLRKYDVSEADFDSSLVWYGRNINQLSEMYDEIIAQLKKQDNEIVEESKKNGEQVSAGYADSLDLWVKSDFRVLSKLYGDTTVSFTTKADDSFKKGDNFELRFRLLDPNISSSILMAVDYKDGSTEYVYKEQKKEGWNNLRFQSDSTKEINRVYGLAKMNLNDKEISFVDSIEVIRTRLDPKNYYYVIQQHALKNKRH